MLAWGSAPRSGKENLISAESAIHFRRHFVHHSRDAPIAQQGHPSHHLSTKNRESSLESHMRPRVHAYLATICRDLGAELVHVGGVADHVHIVTTLPRTLSQADFVEQMKKVSSKWIKTLDARYRGFFWQRGYGALSVNPSQLKALLQYIEAQ